MRKRSVKRFRPVYPSPAALITSVSEDGCPNIITLGEVFNVILLPVRNGTFVRLTPSRRRRLSLLPDRGKPAPPAGR